METNLKFGQYDVVTIEGHKAFFAIIEVRPSDLVFPYSAIHMGTKTTYKLKEEQIEQTVGMVSSTFLNLSPQVSEEKKVAYLEEIDRMAKINSSNPRIFVIRGAKTEPVLFRQLNADKKTFLGYSKRGKAYRYPVSMVQVP